MHRGREERKTVKPTPSITFLILEEPENMIKEKESTFLQYSFVLPSHNPQSWASRDEWESGDEEEQTLSSKNFEHQEGTADYLGLICWGLPKDFQWWW